MIRITPILLVVAVLVAACAGEDANDTSSSPEPGGGPISIGGGGSDSLPRPPGTTASTGGKSVETGFGPFHRCACGEILASQKKMLQRRNETSNTTDEQMQAQFHEHLRAVKYWVARKPNMRVRFIKYNEMVNEPETLCPSIAEFLELPLNIDAMQAVPSRSLYRNRS